MAYVISRFPLISETFILRELEQLREHGWDITLIPLLRQTASVRHREAEYWEQRAWFTPFLSPAIVLANLRALLSRPHVYLGLLLEILVGTWRCPNFLLGGLGIFPKSVYLAERLRRAEVRHIHAHYMTHPALAALVMARLAGASFSVTAHAHDLYVHQDMLQAKVRRARFVATISEFNRRFIARHAGEDLLARVQLVRCGVDPGMFVPTPLPGGWPFRVLCVASLQSYKGLAYLIRACALLKAQGVDFECRIIGSGELYAELSDQIRALGLERDVHLLGAQPQHVVAREMAAAHAFALPSIVARNGKMEGLPVVLMEALASARPAVATRISGIPELVRHEQTGLLVEPGNEHQLASALKRLAHDRRLAAQLACEGRKLVEREFNLERNVVLLEQLLAAADVPPEDSHSGQVLSPRQASGQGQAIT